MKTQRDVSTKEVLVKNASLRRLTTKEMKDIRTGVAAGWWFGTVS